MKTKWCPVVADAADDHDDDNVTVHVALCYPVYLPTYLISIDPILKSRALIFTDSPCSCIPTYVVPIVASRSFATQGILVVTGH